MMTTKIDARKNIIVSLKSNYGERNKGIERHIQTLKVLILMHIVLSILSFGFIFTSLISEYFGYENYKWQNTALFALLSLISLLNLPNNIIELKLLIHLKRINKFNDFDNLEKLNIDLKELINKLNNRLSINNLIPILLGVIILIMSSWQTMNLNNPYWEYMKFPIVIFFGIIITRFVITNKKINDNIKKTENTVANNV
ncbi:hypothetical protein [Lutibacter sp. B1]|uniref:hypothetical protein n=1 Tax=Lutibacter sp. B1 TaxID=2725996 RepID=UPI0014574130|nr:hypothetical protein [Lutibacter sp. B1]NLP59504.1 hypothetical protein [Lutibacter sp. B1]